jgi:hypothetical protein
MALVKIPDEQRSITDAAAVTAYLADRGIEYTRLAEGNRASDDATADELLAAYEPTIRELKG